MSDPLEIFIAEVHDLLSYKLADDRFAQRGILSGSFYSFGPGQWRSKGNKVAPYIEWLPGNQTPLVGSTFARGTHNIVISSRQDLACRVVGSTYEQSRYLLHFVKQVVNETTSSYIDSRGATMNIVNNVEFRGARDVTAQTNKGAVGNLDGNDKQVYEAQFTLDLDYNPEPINANYLSHTILYTYISGSITGSQ